MRWSQRRSGVYDVRYRTAAPMSSEKKRPGGQCCGSQDQHRVSILVDDGTGKTTASLYNTGASWGQMAMLHV